MNESSESVVVEQTYSVSQEALWKAITEHEQMVQWFFDNIPEFKAEEGFQTEFDIEVGDRNFHHVWTITEVVPQQRIVYDWRYREYPGVGKVTFQIMQEGDGSRLRVTNEGIESFPSEVPEFSRESCEAGWKYFLEGNLKDYLEG